MSFQAGIFYFDGQPVPEPEAAALTEYAQPDLFLTPSFQEKLPAITFDGRLDDREDLLSRLDAIPGTDSSDAQLALSAFNRWGIPGLAHLIGDWSLAIWDPARKCIVLASDFAGVRPLYYSIQRNRVVWSTRLQPLVDWLGFIDIDDEYATGFLLSAACADRTPYRGIYSSPPGHAVSIGPEGTRIEQFWKLPVGESIRYRQPCEYEEQLRSLFEDAVRCRLRRGPVLAELSGGLDSSSVVCMASHVIRNRPVDAPPRIITITVEHAKSVDVPFYTAVEKSCGFQSIHVPAADHPFVTEMQTGMVKPATWHGLHRHTSLLAEQMGARTYLTGKLGDLVMGNIWDDSDQVAGLLHRGRISGALRESLAWSKVLRVPIWWVLGRALQSNMPAVLGSHTSGRAEDSVMPEVRKRFESMTADMWFARQWKKAPPERRKYFRGLLELLAVRKLQPPQPLEHLDYTHPYAHRPLVQFMSSIPADVVCGPGEPRRLMRRALQSIWPPELQRRRSKDSFGGVYLDALRPLARMLLQETRPLEVVERGWVEPKSLKKRLELLLDSLDCNEPQLGNVILLELWLRGRRERVRWQNLSVPA